MQPPYRAESVDAGLIENRFGYAKEVPFASWTVVYADGDPIRTHDGFAVFTSLEQAKWAAELMNVAFHSGVDSNKRAIRKMLDIPELPDEG